MRRYLAAEGEHELLEAGLRVHAGVDQDFTAQRDLRPALQKAERESRGKLEPILAMDAAPPGRAFGLAIASVIEGEDIEPMLREPCHEGEMCGEILGVAGVDGNGQRELAETIAGQRQVITGDIVLNGVVVSKASVSERQRMGLRYVTDDRLGEGICGSLGVDRNLVLKRIGQSP